MVAGAGACHGERLHRKPQPAAGLQVFHGQRVVRFAQQVGRVIPRQCAHCPLACGRKGEALRQLALHGEGERLREQELRERAERLCVPALAAEADRAAADLREQEGAALGKPLRAGHRPRQRQLEHGVRAAAQRHLRARPFGKEGRAAALHEIAAHHHGDLLGARLPRGVQERCMAAVEGIEFRNDAEYAVLL